MSKRVFRARKVDANQADIVKAYRSMGAEVHVTSSLGGGFPDIVVAYRGLPALVEIKDGSKPPSARKLSADEEAFCSRFPVRLVESEQDVSDHVQTLDQWAKVLAEYLESECVGK